ncbi:PREDICTED: pentatricopeptide repeat-containing protein At4g33990-like [Nelumbo nucifera]|uniref:Pentatricopeptide repeat-containing protein At4g33990-like n=1 Tax=Nelumbo nucifera TaxID=4432 RepID=A0A1U7Z5T4_NELNU|nr:PREDICTED: pentatricopeptide repeat-containing protein At4g33990-like [Nelumbo nucifera]XP_010248649.1 PREDICTED: pentatricopeptide repeat-containing protein At4g33990-like [Nelumbo nucifera]
MQFRNQLISKRPLFLCNLRIRAATRDGFFTETLEIYHSMLKSGVHGNSFTFPLILKACARLGSLRNGMQIHAHAFLMGFQGDAFVQTALVDMYAKCSNLTASRRVFDEMPVRSLISWNSMISAYCNWLLINESLRLLKQMQVLGFQPNSSTFVSIVSSCYGSGWALQEGCSVHCYAIKLGLDYDLLLSNSIMSMYLQYNQLNSACSVFYSMDVKSVISWTTIIGGYVHIGDVGKAFYLFNQMRHNLLSPDSISLINLTLGCTQLESLLALSSVHALILKSGWNHEYPIQSSLISIYGKCGDLISAQRIFDLADDKNVVLWTSMINGYVHSGHPSEALDLFKRMLLTGVRPNKVTLAIVLSACADLGSLSMGEEVAQYIRLNGLEADLHIQTSLIYMYCKCGNITSAKEVFDRSSDKDLALWSSMIYGYAIHGMGEEALNLFQRMQREEGIKPDEIVYTNVLLACSHSGLVDDGLKYFKSMQCDFGIEPSIEHYSCLVDLLGRSGQLDVALKTIQESPVQANSQIWAPLLSACRIHLNIQLGESVAKLLFDMVPHVTGNYKVLASMYGNIGKWENAAATRRLINDRVVVKEAGWSLVEVNVFDDVSSLEIN